jgi:disulfide bond formation protein DsbB
MKSSAGSSPLAVLRDVRRPLNALAFAFSLGLIAFALYLQHYHGLEPCPLCILQRMAFLATGLLFLVAAVHGPGPIGSRVYAAGITITGLTGAGIATRHVWLQQLPPDQVPECGPGLEYMLEVFPLTETLKMVFAGSGECADISWTLFGLSMPTWSLLCFLCLVTAGLLLNWLPRRM